MDKKQLWNEFAAEPGELDPIDVIDIQNPYGLISWYDGKVYFSDYIYTDTVKDSFDIQSIQRTVDYVSQCIPEGSVWADEDTDSLVIYCGVVPRISTVGEILNTAENFFDETWNAYQDAK